MKNNTLLIKTLTISLFVILLSGFVAYRAGAFETDNKKVIYTKDDSGILNDSPEVKTVEPVIMPSTKSAPVFNPNKKTSNQTPQQTSTPQEKKKLKKKVVKKKSTAGKNTNVDDKNSTPIMPSSKSGFIMNPEPSDTQK